MLKYFRANFENSKTLIKDFDSILFKLEIKNAHDHDHEHDHDHDHRRSINTTKVYRNESYYLKIKL